MFPICTGWRFAPLVNVLALVGFKVLLLAHCRQAVCSQTALGADEQLENRFEAFELRALAPAEFREFIELLTDAMPLQEPTVWSIQMLERGYELTSGYVGRASYLVQEASALAVLSGKERIGSSIIRSSELQSTLAALSFARSRAGRRTKRPAG